MNYYKVIPKDEVPKLKPRRRYGFNVSFIPYLESGQAIQISCPDLTMARARRQVILGSLRQSRYGAHSALRSQVLAERDGKATVYIWLEDDVPPEN